MADAGDVRRLALGLPHVEEIESDGFDFRVGGKGFVWSYPERPPGQRRRIRTDIAVLYVGDEAEKQALLLGEPDKFFTAPGYDGWPLVLLRLAKVDPDREVPSTDELWYFEEREDVGNWFTRHGWDVTVTPSDQLMAGYGRSAPKEIQDAVPGNLFVAAQR